MGSDNDDHDDEASEADADEPEASSSPVEERLDSGPDDDSGETDDTASDDSGETEDSVTDDSGETDDTASDDSGETGDSVTDDSGTDDGGRDPSVSPVEERLGSGRADESDTDAPDEESTAESDESATDDESDPTDAVTDDESAPEADDKETTEVEVARENGSALAAIVSFIVPGLGHVVNGDNERGAIIFLVYMAWVFLAWGIGFFLIGTFISVITLGLGFIVQILIALVLVPVDIIFHVVAAIDAYQRSDMVDKVTVKVDELR